MAVRDITDVLACWTINPQGAPLSIDLPTDRPRPAVPAYVAGHESFTITAGLHERLVRTHGDVPVTLLAALEILLFRYSGQQEFALGSTTASLSPGQSVRDLLARLSAAAPEPSPAAGDCPESDLVVSFTHTDGTLRGDIDYDSALYDETTIRRLIGHLEIILDAIATEQDQPVSAVPLLTGAERHQLLVEWNQTRVQYPDDQCIFQLFERQAELSPGSVAAVYDSQPISYGELNTRANQLAHYLRSAGVRPSSLVGVLVERSIEMIIALLGISKAGGAYVPLDPDYPADRLSFMIEDAAAPAVVTLGRLAGRLPASDAKIIALDTCWAEIAQQPASNPEPVTTARDLAYMIYTSGSTGRPKGVMVEHRSVVNLVSASSYVRFGADRTFLQFVPLPFDVSTFEIWGALAHGARLVIAPAGPVSLGDLGRLVRDEGVTTMWLTAPLFHEMVNYYADAISGVEEILSGGDVISPAQFSRMLKLPGNRTVTNGYGPTEATTYTTTYAARSADGERPDIGARVPVGRPIANMKTYILDEHRQPVPIGVTGELYIGGDGLARGYFNRPALTAERFVDDPFSTVPGSRLYRTGDLVRYLPDGTIDFLTRIDHQVKVRGFRIELGEIEAALAAHPAVRDCIVVTRGEGASRYLAAYLVAAGTPPADAELKARLEETLPAYMVPAKFVFLDAFSLTPNGKVDRKALPDPDAVPAAPAAPDASSATGTQDVLLSAWRRVLGAETLGVNDNFFENGGHSLLALRSLAIVSKALGRKVSVAAMYKNPTVAELSAWINQTQQ